MTPIFNIFVSVAGGAADDSFAQMLKVNPHTNITINPIKDNRFIICTSYNVFIF
jgi:hypothetical protein